MSSFRKGSWLLAACLVAGLPSQVAAQVGGRFEGIGRAATTREVAVWDIDVRPDFKGLPAGAGSVVRGQVIWEAQCASCHGVFGESNQVFTPLVGGTTAKDIQSGNVASLKDNSYPGRTTLMKLSTLSTLWDYISRAMPWNAPKSLSPDEVYAVTAFMLNLGGVVPDDFTLSDTNIREVQARLPNRNGTTTAHGLWPGREFGGKAAPDVKAAACMRNCNAGNERARVPQVASQVPDYARNAHGNLAEQNRLVGAQRGADTTLAERPAGSVVAVASPSTATSPAPSPAPSPSPVAAVKTAQPDSPQAAALASKYSCTACHGMAQKIVGPGFTDIAKKYPGNVNYLARKIVDGGGGVWGAVPMPPQTIPEADAQLLAAWLATGALR